MKYIAILGSTGSIGRQTLEVVELFPQRLKVVALAAGRNRQAFLQQCLRYRPRLVSLELAEDAKWLQEQLAGCAYRPAIHYGLDGLITVATCAEASLVVTALSGAVGLIPTCAAIKARKQIALANKETLVAAGQYVSGLAEQYGVSLLPVDSEHSAIWQCLQEENRQAVQRLLLTASGGPFRQLDQAALKQVTPAMALQHPNWSMGQKITVDSATLMNKGLEVIEARWLFNVDYDQIDVVIHPQSIIHSMVEYGDGSLLAHLGMPDMRIPIQYALSYPERWFNQLPRLQVNRLKGLTFEEPDTERFPALALAYQAGRQGGAAPAVLNAANEVAVHAFLAGCINFLDIPYIVAKTLDKYQPVNPAGLDEIIQIDSWARAEAQKIIKRQ
ncbi:1-deoxy-D-xylulose-5-phosphate reductoisomerase [Desulforamulus hydrothermalis]|uniref:1-deoxy-D-xylulose 5-phosphate reductoisomerase n=1 Tax=Desulforamulus hydrothermalis Lam5 = DSM 18033 TaxID=1121428 RepID=K8E145_9FIRM|nr:1-deoxy-D-xylulose-5-phosphate reductoisomerase [Desulforamulus hydrothermalis]CCO09437.1 1-deoxy-D-xylulose 5-phosphate reductoisomerase [Desulforamulus hydrothermalis Lam5 = DSM 18033]SHH08167.1 1-deoxy-D-xylulose 5-phosphate reductoisomerase [Desulforamulus hydrothermalis Lam5 = DSM 18033]